MSGGLFTALPQRFSQDLTRAFLHTADGGTRTYGDLMAASGRAASALAALGVKPGDRVAVQTEKTPETLMLFFGALRAGAVYLPLNTAYTAAEVAYFLGDAEPALVVCDPARLDSISAVAGGAKVLTLDASGRGSFQDVADAQSPDFKDVPRSANDLAAILYTSGTTGRSKGAMLSHANLLSNAETLVDYWRFTKDDVLLHALPIFHAHGLFVATNIMALAGGSMIFLPKFDVEQVTLLLPRATTMMGVPTFYTRLMAHPKFTRELVAH